MGPAPREGLARASLRSGVACAVLLGLLALCASAQAVGSPQVEATWATNVAATSAGLHAQVNPDELPTTVRFEYLTEAAYQANLAAVPPREGFAGATATSAGGLSGQQASRSLSGLTPATTYRYRAVAINSAAPAGIAGAANFFVSEETAAIFSLPDSRGWEMVSPIDKNGGAIQGPGENFGGDLLQAAAQGDAVTYSSSSSFGEGAQGAPAASQYLAGRGGGGWSAANITAPQRSGAEPEAGAGVPYRLFSPDLGSALFFSGGSCLGPGVGCANPSPPLSGSGAPAGYQNYYLRTSSSGSYQALITAADAPALTLPAEAFEVSLAGASADLGQVVLSTCAKLTPEASEQPLCESGGPNLYRRSGGALALVNPPGLTDAHLAAQSGAISADGSRVYFTATEDAFLYVREGETAKLVSNTGSFQTASANGALAFYLDAGQLFRYAAQPGTSEPIATEVQGVLGASEDGSRVYYETAAGLFLWQAGPPPTITQVAPSGTLPAAEAANYPPTTGTARVSADGTHLVFTSIASLTGFDNTDSGTKAPDAEAFLYDATANGGAGGLLCVSCNPANERPIGPASIPGALANGEGALATQSYKPRVLSADGRRLFFDTEDALALQDTNNRPDVYEWEAPGSGSCAGGSAVNGGCVRLISSGRDGEASEFIDASAEGGDAFFRTAASLVPTDPGSYDLYDAREGGGFPIPPSPIPCNGDACQPLPSPPEDPTPGTLVPSAGNPPPRFTKEHRRRKHHRRKHHTKQTHRKIHAVRVTARSGW